VDAGRLPDQHRQVAPLSLGRIHRFLLRSCWASGRSLRAIERSIAGSLCHGVYCRDVQLGFARVVTDCVTSYWLCDVFIDEEH